MFNDIEITLAIYNKKIPKIYNATLIITIIIVIALIIIFTFKYQTFYITKGRIINNELELLVNCNDLKYLDKNILYIDSEKYTFKIIKISQEIYTDDEYNTYKYIYLKVRNLINIDNYVYEIKIPKENKILAKYIKEELWN